MVSRVISRTVRFKTDNTRYNRVDSVGEEQLVLREVWKSLEMSLRRTKRS